MESETPNETFKFFEWVFAGAAAFSAAGIHLIADATLDTPLRTALFTFAIALPLTLWAAIELRTTSVNGRWIRAYLVSGIAGSLATVVGATALIWHASHPPAIAFAVVVGVVLLADLVVG